VLAIGPVVQHYLTGPIGGRSAPRQSGQAATRRT
jgi:hypothetical protein